MGKFFDENYLLDGENARKIYAVIRDMPIYDYHSHLDAKEMYEDKPYNDITELWLMGDHYKWRLMRMAGVPEELITGNASHQAKFKAFAEILPLFIGNPVRDWAQMELKRYFDINVPIDRSSADYIYRATEEIIKERRYSPRKLITMMNVDTLMTTDDPLDSLEYHEKLRDVDDFKVKVLPSFRADRVLNIVAKDFRDYILKLSKMTDIKIVDIDTLMEAVKMRLDYFVERGSVITDLSILDIPRKGSMESANRAFMDAMNTKSVDKDDADSYIFHVLVGLAKLYKERDIVMQVHIGATRNQNTRRFNLIGRDTGIDSIGDPLSVSNLQVYLDTLEMSDGLPRSIYYTHNSNAYMTLSTMLGNFAGDIKGKLQLGAAWWMNDSKEGILRQLEVTKNTAGLGYFNGMLTDSRSYTSYVRHDYFRRVLASYLGKMVDAGSVILDDILFDIAKDIAYNNAKNFFG